MKPLLFLLISFSLFQPEIWSQPSFYFVEFDKKDSLPTDELVNPEIVYSQRAIARRNRFHIPLVTYSDLPVKDSYVARVTEMGFTIWAKSKWLNGAIIMGEKDSVESLRKLSFVTSITFAGYYEEERKEKKKLEERIHALEARFGENPKNKVYDDFYGAASTQVRMLGVQRLHRQGIKGDRILIAVLDAGFKNVDRISLFKKLFDEKQFVATYDFVSNNNLVFDDDEHGTAVLSCMALDSQQVFVGTAPGAQYLLYRTENANSEYIVEEYLWACAAEAADSAGADIINSSLGYSRFDDRKMGHEFKELDGQSTIAARAANLAWSKGIVVVSSAGNEAENAWERITTPGDADSIITVAACDFSKGYAGFSSQGPNAAKRQKPDLAAMGQAVAICKSNGLLTEGKGTSFSAPILCGALACFIQAHPELPPHIIKNVLKQSAHQFTHPDKYLGYGVPDFGLASTLLNPILTDSILDVTFSKGKYLMSFMIQQVQKATLSIENVLGVEVWHSKEKFKIKGLNRGLVKLPKKIKPGTYVLKLITQGTISTYTFSVPE